MMFRWDDMRSQSAWQWLRLCGAREARAFAKRHQPGGHERYHAAVAQHDRAAIAFAEAVVAAKGRAA